MYKVRVNERFAVPSAKGAISRMSKVKDLNMRAKLRNVRQKRQDEKIHFVKFIILKKMVLITYFVIYMSMHIYKLLNPKNCQKFSLF